MTMVMQKRLASLALLLAVLMLSACGFRLAGTTAMPQSLSVIQLNTEGFTEAQRASLVNRLQQAGSTIVTNGQSEAPTLSVNLGKLVEYSLFQTGEVEQTKRLVQQMTYQLKAADGSLLLAERQLRQENSYELDLYNVAASERDRQELQQVMQDVLTSRMIYQLQQM